MNEPFKVAVVGPARVGKTTLLTAILTQTEELLAGTPVDVVMDETTESRVRKQRARFRRAIEVGMFDADALKGTQSVSSYEITLQADGDVGIEIPFHVLDYPGKWLNPEERARSNEARSQWPHCESHIKHSIMLLLPIDSAVLMEATSAAQRGAVPDLLGLVDVEAVARRWARERNQRPGEPAVLLLAPLKCEKYFDDNGGRRREAHLLRQRVIEKYKGVLGIVQAESTDRTIRVVYAPIDTYGCIQLTDAEWRDPDPDAIESGDAGHPELRGHYRFRSRSPEIKVKAADTVMQELSRCVMLGQAGRTEEEIGQYVAEYMRRVSRRTEQKGFWGALGYYLGGEARENKNGIQRSQAEIAHGQRRHEQLIEAIEKLAASPADKRVEVW